jgi:hypothetical protein
VNTIEIAERERDRTSDDSRKVTVNLHADTRNNPG